MSAEEKHSPERSQARSSSKDVTPLLKGWDYEPGTINVRKINGIDGAEGAKGLDGEGLRLRHHKEIASGGPLQMRGFGGGRKLEQHTHRTDSAGRRDHFLSAE